MQRLGKDFFTQDALQVAPELLGKTLARKLPTGEIIRAKITETEAYRGEEDAACHARAGRTARTAIMYERGGLTYIYLCYGMHYLLNIVTGEKDFPQAVLIRAGSIGVKAYNGPAKLTKAMLIGKELNGADLITSEELWLEDGEKSEYKTASRVGINYAAEPYKSIEWRFIMKQEYKQL